MNPPESCEEKVLFLGGKKIAKSLKMQEKQLGYPSEGGACHATLWPEMGFTDGMAWHRRFLRVSLVALGGPILGFLGVGLAGTTVIT